MLDECIISVTFKDWLASLETVMREWDAKHGNLPYTLPLTGVDNEGNVLCWKDSYDDGMTPEEAFASDRTYWEE